MLNADRLRERMDARGLKQSQLARLVGVSQQNVSFLLSGEAQGSKRIHAIARELGTTAAYLMGEIDDPDEGAPPPPPDPTHHLVMLPVALPTEAALARMFEGLLRPFELDHEALLARTLARQLPKGLRLLQGPLIEAPVDDLETEAVEAPANGRRAPRRARRT